MVPIGELSITFHNYFIFSKLDTAVGLPVKLHHQCSTATKPFLFSENLMF